MLPIAHLTMAEASANSGVHFAIYKVLRIVCNIVIDRINSYVVPMINALSPQGSGFEDRADSSLTWVDGTRTLTLVGTAYDALINGIHFAFTANKTKQIANTNGVHSIYLDSSGVAQETTGAVPASGLLVARVLWDVSAAAASRVIDERHRSAFTNDNRQIWDDTDAARFAYGCEATTSALPAGAPPDDSHEKLWFAPVTGATVGSYYNEDFEVEPQNGAGAALFEQNLGSNLGATPALLPVFHRETLVGVTYWRKTAATIYPFTYGGVNLRPNYNPVGGGIYTLAESPDQRAVVVWVMACADLHEPVFSVLHPVTYATVREAKATATPTSLDILNATYDLVNAPRLLYRLILWTDATYAPAPVPGPALAPKAKIAAVTDYRDVAYRTESGWLTPSHDGLADVDLDTSVDSFHHTIGTGATQACPGTEPAARALADSTHASLAVSVGHLPVVKADCNATLQALLTDAYHGSAMVRITDTHTTGVAQPASLADALFVGLAAGGSVNGAGTAGVVASSFAAAAVETGVGAGDAGLGAAAAADRPYPVATYPGQRGILCGLKKADGDEILLPELLSTAPVTDLLSPVVCYLSYRSDLGVNAKWRLWYYYRSHATGLDTPFTPDTSLANVSLYIPEVLIAKDVPVATGLGAPLVGQEAAALGPGSVVEANLAANCVSVGKLSAGVQAVLTDAHRNSWRDVITATHATGVAQPASLADALFVGLAAGGSVDGAGTAGVVASSFAAAAVETGVGAGDAGLGAAAAADRPYPVATYPGQRGVYVELRTQDDRAVSLLSMLSTATGIDCGASVYAYLSYRSDLGANLKWRLWYYYKANATGLETPFTPDTSVANVTVKVPRVETLDQVPVDAGWTGGSGGGGGGAVNAAMVIADTANTLAVPLVLAYTFAAGVGGAPDDVTIYNATAPAMRILRAELLVSTAVAASTVVARSAAGGGGSALTDTFSTPATGVIYEVDRTAPTTIAGASSIYLRRSDSGVAGTLILWVVRS